MTLAPLLLSGCLGMDQMFVPKEGSVLAPEQHADTSDASLDLVCWYTDGFTQRERTEHLYEIFLVADSSGSMYQDQDHVTTELKRIWNKLPLRDWQLFGIPIDRDYVSQSRLFTFEDTVDDLQDWYGNLSAGMYEAGFPALESFMESSLARDSLRPDAIYSTIFISDEDNDSLHLSSYLGWMDADAFVKWYPTVAAETHIDSVVHTDSSASCYGTLSEVGSEYIDVTDALGGDVYDICSDYWGRTLDDLPKQKDSYDSWPLTYVPLPETITVVADNQIFYPWYYDAGHQEVLFDTLPEGEVLIRYMIDPQTIDECPE